MLIKLFVICSLIVASYAWLAPERCSQKKAKREVKNAVTNFAQLVNNIDEIATRQNGYLKEIYKSHNLVVTPVITTNCDFHGSPDRFEFRLPTNCSFHTYAPQLISAVSCHTTACELTHEVTTIDTYTAVEGYDWGVKVSEKASLFEIIEVGGEVSVGGTYSCTYNKGKTISDTIKCSDSGNDRGEIQLFNVKSDMVCDFARVKFEIEQRHGKSSVLIPIGIPGSVTQDDIDNLKASETNDLILLRLCPGIEEFYLNSYHDQVVGSFIQKLKKGAPFYNSETDLVCILRNVVLIYYYKSTTSVQNIRRVIPFTKKNGNSVYQFACIKTTY